MTRAGFGLTARARELLVYISERETCPSFEEMRVALGLESKSGVHRLVDQLEERGYVRRLKYRARAIEVIRRAEQEAPPITLPGYKPGCPDVLWLPLHGRID